MWIGGNWPNRRPFQRAARWDGVVPEKVGGQLPTPDDVRDLSAYIAERRAAASVEGSRPFDVVIGGVSHAADAEGEEIARSYADAGATWWMERFHPSRGSVDDARRRIADGPPR